MLTIIVFGCACQTNKTPLEPVVENDFAMYLLADTTLNGVQASETSLGNLELADEPIITLNDIKYYNWQEHSFSLKESAIANLGEIFATRQSVFGIPFVVVAQNSRRYMGAFWFAYSSYAPDFPHVEAIELLVKNSDPTEFHIGKGYTVAVDRRNDELVYQALKNAGKLRE